MPTAKKTGSASKGASYEVLCEHIVVTTKDGEVRIEQGEVTKLIPSRDTAGLLARGRIKEA